MYSKALSNKDMWRRSAPPDVKLTERDGVRLPVNYKGTAFNSDGTYSRTYTARAKDTAVPTVETVEQAEPSPEKVVREIELPPPPPKDEKKADESKPAGLSDLLRSLGGGMANSKGFPFGHGIGFEELLLLGLILFISDDGNSSGCSKEEQDLTRLLLAALLFCG
ncbi:MAG: hypothetical protein E7589_00155 [Ruminococcaceae bacterium]|nr:hypothetical protein [Oscillospiraceae bacterium]